MNLTKVRLLALPIALALVGAAKLPEKIDIPPEKPRSEQPPGAETNSAEQDEISPAGGVPKPESKPVIDDEFAEPEKDKSGEKSTSEKNATMSPDIIQPIDNEAELAACEAELNKLEVSFERDEKIVGKNGCGIGVPYSVNEIAPGVALKPATQLRCMTVLAMARWIDREVLPAVEMLPDNVTLSSVAHGSTYVCRRRNNSATGKMSEHSLGNAIDVVGFTFKGREAINISPRAGKGTIEEAFQRAVRAGACLHFTTVLGPGSDENHNDHLHLDIKERRGGYRLCQ